MKKIGLIVDSISEQSTGIGYYTKSIISKITTKGNIKSFFIDYEQKDFNKENLILVKNRFIKFRTYLWHNFLPYLIRDIKLEYILNFSGCPHLLRYKQKEILFVYDISWDLFPHFHPLSRVIFFKLFFKNSLNNSFIIIADSEHTKNDLINYYNIPSKKIIVIYPTLDKNIAINKKPKKLGDFPFILYIGTIEPRKNIESIIKAYYLAKIRKNIPHKLIISGKRGWKYSKVFKLISELNLSNDVIYTGYITDSEKAYLYRKATVFVYPSFYEGFGIPPLEAMKYGCPVITSNTSSLPEVVGRAGLLVNPDNINELANSIFEVINNNRLRNNMIKNSKKQIKKFSNKTQIDQLLNLITTQ